MCFRLAVVLFSLFLSSTSLMAAEVVLTVVEAWLPEATDDEPRPDAVYVRFDPDSTEALADFSATHLGEMAGIYVEDQLVFSARLREVITNGSLALFVGGESERIITAEELLERLKTGIPIKVIAPFVEE